MKIYISGKITNVENWEDCFNAVEYYIKTKHFPKAEIYNPVDFSQEVQKKIKRPTHSDYMRYDIEKLLECDAVYLIPNWQGSKGVEAELTVAEICEIPIEKISEAALHSIIIEYRQKVMQK